MRKLKQAVSLTLALALSLALTVPAMAAGEPGSTTIQDDKGFSYTLSKPVAGTRDIDSLGRFYQIREGTIITPVLPEGAVKEADEYGQISYTLTDEEGSSFVVEYTAEEFVDASLTQGPGYEGTWDTMPCGYLEGVTNQPFPKGLYVSFQNW